MEGFPRSVPKPDPDDVVQVAMTEQMARYFEARCLGLGHTKGDTYLVGPLIFSENDLPTYTIGIKSLPND